MSALPPTADVARPGNERLLVTHTGHRARNHSVFPSVASSARERVTGQGFLSPNPPDTGWIAAYRDGCSGARVVLLSLAAAGNHLGDPVKNKFFVSMTERCDVTSLC